VKEIGASIKLMKGNPPRDGSGPQKG